MKHKKKEKGFTLIELVISAGIFSVLAISIAGVFIGAMRSYQNVLLTKRILSETSYAMEFMSRAMRMAPRDRNGTCVPLGTTYQLLDLNTKIRFINALQNNECQEFYRDPLSKTIKTRKLIGGQTMDLTSSGVEILALKFETSGNSSGDELQPIITIYLEATKGNTPPIKIQTSVSQRNLDL